MFELASVIVPITLFELLPILIPAAVAVVGYLSDRRARAVEQRLPDR